MGHPIFDDGLVHRVCPPHIHTIHGYSYCLMLCLNLLIWSKYVKSWHTMYTFHLAYHEVTFHCDPKDPKDRTHQVATPKIGEPIPCHSRHSPPPAPTGSPKRDGEASTSRFRDIGLATSCQQRTGGSFHGACHIFSGWWLSPSPLKNDGVRQLG